MFSQEAEALQHRELLMVLLVHRSKWTQVTSDLEFLPPRILVHAISQDVPQTSNAQLNVCFFCTNDLIRVLQCSLLLEFFLLISNIFLCHSYIITNPINHQSPHLPSSHPVSLCSFLNTDLSESVLQRHLRAFKAYIIQSPALPHYSV